jgi:undecaprenyl-diphosphatase
VTDLPVLHAVALGGMQGPAELLPVSSSAHLVLVPELLSWPYSRLDPELRKAFEVALHAGTSVALLVFLRGELSQTARALDARHALAATLALGPPAAAGLLLEARIEREAGTPRRVAGTQILAGMALALSDLRPATRAYADAGLLDHLLLGIAQATALVPGVSRNGATLTVARLRGLDRPAASALSRDAALPIIVSAAVLKSVRLRSRGLPGGLRARFVAGAGAAALSTLASRRLLAWAESASSLAALSAYRVAFGAWTLRRLGSRPGRTR